MKIYNTKKSFFSNNSLPESQSPINVRYFWEKVEHLGSPKLSDEEKIPVKRGTLKTLATELFRISRLIIIIRQKLATQKKRT